MCNIGMEVGSGSRLECFTGGGVIRERGADGDGTHVLGAGCWIC